MPDSRPKLTYKDLFTIIGFVITVTVFLLSMRGQARDHNAEMVLMKDKVERHEKILEEYNIAVMSEQMKNISEDVSEVKVMFTDFIKEYNANHN